MALFDEEEIHEDLHLMIAESPDESQTVVYGEEYVKFTVISDVCSAHLSLPTPNTVLMLIHPTCK